MVLKMFIFKPKRYLIIIVSLLFLSSGCLAGIKNIPPKKINIEITSHLGDKQLFVQGDVIKFLISLDIDAYIIVIYQAANGKLIQLLPNEKEKNTLYKAGLFISVPSDTVPYKFTIQPPYGKEKVWVFASDKQSNKLKGKVLANGLRIVTITIQKIKNQIRASSVNYFGNSSFSLHTSQK